MADGTWQELEQQMDLRGVPRHRFLLLGEIPVLGGHLDMIDCSCTSFMAPVPWGSHGRFWIDQSW